MATNTVEVIPAGTKVTTTHKDGDVKATATPTSATPVERIYLDADAVLNQIPVTTLNELNFLVNAHSDYSKFIAAGHTSDNDRAAYRTALIVEMISAAYKQKDKAVKAQIENKSRKFYLELIARGNDKATAQKLANYYPL